MAGHSDFDVVLLLLGESIDGNACSHGLSLALLLAFLLAAVVVQGRQHDLQQQIVDRGLRRVCLSTKRRHSVCVCVVCGGGVYVCGVCGV